MHGWEIFLFYCIVLYCIAIVIVILFIAYLFIFISSSYLLNQINSSCSSVFGREMVVMRSGLIPSVVGDEL